MSSVNGNDHGHQLTPPKWHLPSQFTSFHAWGTPQIAFVDKTDVIALLPERFRYLLLLPPRYGKTMLVSMLTLYYGLHGFSDFPEHFRALNIAKKVPTPHNRHIYLSFDFGPLRGQKTLDSISCALDDVIDVAFSELGVCYRYQLGIIHWAEKRPNEVVWLLDLIEQKGYSLFVSVDNYDALFHPVGEPISQSFYRDAIALLEARFWTPLRADVVHKLIVTGVFLLPGLDLPPRIPAEFINGCGFTELEATNLASLFLGQSMDVDRLRSTCNYSAPGSTYSTFHPQLVLDWIAVQDSPNDEELYESYATLADMLKCLPTSSSNPNVASQDGLIALLTVGRVKITELDAFAEDDPTKITWAAILQAGGLIPDAEADHYKIFNKHVLSLIHAQVDRLVLKRYDSNFAFMITWGDYCIWNRTAPFTGLLAKILHDMLRFTFFGLQPEPTLLGVFELIFRYKEALERWPLLPFILRPRQADPMPITVILPTRSWLPEFMDLELVNLSLEGMWYGLHANDLDQRRPTPGELEALFDHFCGLDIPELVQQPYRASLNDSTVVTVESFTNCVVTAPRFVSVGGAHVVGSHWLPDGVVEN
ncbi:AAA-ATPase-like domain-containing protein [Mycena indigotica]|uniref:AAA-ATPase-like domain-containing protein n=1 Tax=Mycena indigotica TaxID=2126181 RepID=A0A8H6S9G7_9AGAR|nr:AAA-ATPase-like domain-containing protein [Mycena indigotica]KAF7295288.1 AAA-ATPase-like domain-containing protein [Mycena indigotica]